MTDREVLPRTKLTTKVYASINDVPQAAWDALLGGASRTFSHAFWDVIERSGLNDFSYHHVLFFAEGEAPVALTTFYSVTTDIAIFAPRPLRAVLGVVRRAWPNFLKLRMLECGTPIILNSPPFVLAPDVPADEVIAALDDLLQRTARADGQLLIVVRDFEPPAQDFRPDFARLGYHWVDGLPNNYLDIRWKTADEYLAAMKSYYRSKLLKHLKRNAARGMSCAMVEDFAGMAETLCRQWLTVHDNASEFQREILTPDFYALLSALPESRVLLFNEGERLIGHALIFMDGDLLRWLYFGREVAVNDSLYIYVGFKVVEAAITLGAARLEMGLTTYPIKQDLGAIVTPISMAVRSAVRILNPFVGMIYPLLNQVPKIVNRPVFKS